KLQERVLDHVARPLQVARDLQGISDQRSLQSDQQRLDLTSLFLTVLALHGISLLGLIEVSGTTLGCAIRSSRFSRRTIRSSKFATCFLSWETSSDGPDCSAR